MHIVRVLCHYGYEYTASRTPHILYKVYRIVSLRLYHDTLPGTCTGTGTWYRYLVYIYMLEPLKWRMYHSAEWSTNLQNGRRGSWAAPAAAILDSAEWSTNMENPVLHFG